MVERSETVSKVLEVGFENNDLIITGRGPAGAIQGLPFTPDDVEDILYLEFIAKMLAEAGILEETLSLIDSYSAGRLKPVGYQEYALKRVRTEFEKWQVKPHEEIATD